MSQIHETSPPDLFEILQSEAVLTAPAADALRRRTSDRWAPIGKILRQKGWLSMSQLMDLLDLQGEEPAIRLGQLAVQAGFCTRAQVDSALDAQRELSPHPLEVLLQDPEIDRVRLTFAIVRYVRMLEALAEASPAGSEPERGRRKPRSKSD